MDVSSLMNAKMQAQAARLQVAALRAVQETQGQFAPASQQALSTLSQAIVQSQDHFAVSASKTISGIDIVV
ncbi:hypothetical protein [Candidatus Phycosocius spiralis]|uniref:hypothetical protein n=1 Tax=Candidatus Phycosocius spiralis TaxID=2815099 RepID=UPI0024E1053E|nr:hypothetical protein [Candidatus Phycosocius spiralis]